NAHLFDPQQLAPDFGEPTLQIRAGRLVGNFAERASVPAGGNLGFGVRRCVGFLGALDPSPAPDVRLEENALPNALIFLVPGTADDHLPATPAGAVVLVDQRANPL